MAFGAEVPIPMKNIKGTKMIILNCGGALSDSLIAQNTCDNK
jgi:hypothetical protein